MIAIILAHGFEEIEAIAPIDILRRAGIGVTIFGVQSTLIAGGHDIAVECDDLVENLTTDIDGVIIPGGHEGALNIANSSTCCDIIQELNKERKMIAAICAAPALVLEPLNILTGKHFTCYPTYQRGISSGCYQNSPVVVDRNIITAQAAGSALLFAQEIVAHVKSIEIASQTMKKIYFTAP